MEQTTLGKRLNMVRKDCGYTAEQLSEICNINATYLRQIEGGKKIPSLPVFVDLCNALKISPDYLLQDVLCSNEISEIQQLTALWKAAPPSRQSLVIALLHAALEWEEEHS